MQFSEGCDQSLSCDLGPTIGLGSVGLRKSHPYTQPSTHGFEPLAYELSPLVAGDLRGNAHFPPPGIDHQVGGFFASQAQLCGGAGQGPTGQAVHAEQKTVERFALPLDRWHGEHVHADRKPQPFGHRINPNWPLRGPVWWFGCLAHCAGLSHPRDNVFKFDRGCKNISESQLLCHALVPYMSHLDMV